MAKRKRDAAEQIISQSGTEAVVRGQLTYYKGADCTPSEYIFDHYLE